MPDDIRIETTVLPPKPELRAGANVTAIVPRSIEEVFRVAKAVVTAGLAPDSYTRERGSDLPPDEIISRVVIGIMKGAEVGFPPITALSTIAIINKRPCIWGEGAVALIQSSGVLEKMKIEYFGGVPDGETETAKFTSDYGCRVTMWRRGQSEPYVGEFTVGDAKRAHLWMNTKRVPWIEYPKRQMKWRAFSFPAKDGFADCLMGIAIREEVEDLPAIERKTADVSFLDDAPTQLAISHQAERPMAPISTSTAEPERIAVSSTPAAGIEAPSGAPPSKPAPTAGATDAAAPPPARAVGADVSNGAARERRQPGGDLLGTAEIAPKPRGNTGMYYWGEWEQRVRAFLLTITRSEQVDEFRRLHQHWVMESHKHNHDHAQLVADIQSVADRFADDTQIADAEARLAGGG